MSKTKTKPTNKKDKMRTTKTTKTTNKTKTTKTRFYTITVQGETKDSNNCFQSQSGNITVNSHSEKELYLQIQEEVLKTAHFKKDKYSVVNYYLGKVEVNSEGI